MTPPGTAAPIGPRSRASAAGRNTSEGRDPHPRRCQRKIGLPVIYSVTNLIVTVSHLIQVIAAISASSKFFWFANEIGCCKSSPILLSSPGFHGRTVINWGLMLHVQTNLPSGELT